MTIAEISRRIELHFWDWAIPTLSASPRVQHGVRWIYRMLHKTPITQRYLIGGSLAVFGFSNGMLLYWFLVR